MWPATPEETLVRDAWAVVIDWLVGGDITPIAWQIMKTPLDTEAEWVERSLLNAFRLDVSTQSERQREALVREYRDHIAGAVMNELKNFGDAGLDVLAAAQLLKEHLGGTHVAEHA